MKKKPIYRTFYYDSAQSLATLEIEMNKMYEEGYRYIGSIRFILIFELIPM